MLVVPFWMSRWPGVVGGALPTIGWSVGWSRWRRLGAALLAASALGPLAPAVAGAAQEDPGLARQWSLRTINAATAWATSTGGGVKIGIIDTGIDLDHEDLRGKVVAHASCVGSAGDPAACGGSAQDDNGHGTHVAGVAGAITGNGRGIAGVAPDAQFVIVKALTAEGAGVIGDVNAGIKWAVDHGAQIVNLSLGDPNFVLTAVLGSSLQEGIDYAWSHGVVPVLAAGNSNESGLGLGGSEYGDLDAIVVGATGRDDSVAKYSSPLGTAKWAMVAPGGSGDGTPASDILSTFWFKDHPNAYAEAAGTSMAAPHVAGAVALLLAKGYSPQQAVDAVLANADKNVQCNELLSNCAGRLDAGAAVTAPAPPRQDPSASNEGSGESLVALPSLPGRPGAPGALPGSKSVAPPAPKGLPKPKAREAKDPLGPAFGPVILDGSALGPTTRPAARSTLSIAAVVSGALVGAAGAHRPPG